MKCGTETFQINIRECCLRTFKCNLTSYNSSNRLSIVACGLQLKKKIDLTWTVWKTQLCVKWTDCTVRALSFTRSWLLWNQMCLTMLCLVYLVILQTPASSIHPSIHLSTHPPHSLGLEPAMVGAGSTLSITGHIETVYTLPSNLESPINWTWTLHPGKSKSRLHYIFSFFLIFNLYYIHTHIFIYYYFRDKSKGSICWCLQLETANKSGKHMYAVFRTNWWSNILQNWNRKTFFSLDLWRMPYHAPRNQLQLRDKRVLEICCHV